MRDREYLAAVRVSLTWLGALRSHVLRHAAFTHASESAGGVAALLAGAA